MSCTVTDGVADVRLDRADKLNALDPSMASALIATGERLRRDPRVRVVVVSGNGRAFCAGLDLRSFQAMAGGQAVRLRHDDEQPYTGAASSTGQRAAHVWAELPMPVIAAVHGVAFGGGLQIALGADIRMVAPDARLSVMEIRWGLAPDMTGTQVLPELVGRDVAKELTFTGRIVDGEEAGRIGLATKVTAEPRKAALELAREIAGKNPQAIRWAKQLLDLAGRTPIADGFAAEQQAIGELIGSRNQVEAVRANLDERTPVFTDDPQ
ncbi:crotonase/enoyl-CoA hydratase family protein [Prauserella sp. ASG 168]|uniref:Crotonase/enoyl-CoA hydratase family protein n=1 Tax=Prauserella cavernicola TaxID=2800127 RepID=A0A934R109_9PSEU|nr:crotonase/enoyl-CoA hydratase family protein [Prauserella cavernicola]